jgi:hypothetical protein
MHIVDPIRWPQPQAAQQLAGWSFTGPRYEKNYNYYRMYFHKCYDFFRLRPQELQRWNQMPVQGQGSCQEG